jgi:hypothetical protein
MFLFSSKETPSGRMCGKDLGASMGKGVWVGSFSRCVSLRLEVYGGGPARCERGCRAAYDTGGKFASVSAPLLRRRGTRLSGDFQSRFLALHGHGVDGTMHADASWEIGAMMITRNWLRRC